MRSVMWWVAAVSVATAVGGCTSSSLPEGDSAASSAGPAEPAEAIEPVDLPEQAEPDIAVEPVAPDMEPDKPAAAAMEPGFSGSESTNLKQPSVSVPSGEAPARFDGDSGSSAGALADDVAAFQIPPAWVAEVPTEWDVAGKPWKDGRIEIRRLLGLNDEASRREAIKLMWDYKLKEDMGNGHEYGMYTYLGKEPVWAVIAFREELGHPDESFNYPPYFAAQGLASILTQYGEFDEAEAVLKRAAKWTPPPPSGKFAKPGTGWVEVRQAESHDALGDLYAAWGKTDKALKHYRDAVRIFPTGKPPYGKHTLPRKAKKVQAKIDLIEGGSLTSASLRNGTYRANAIGYSGDVKLTVEVAAGKVADIKIAHQEKIDQGATKIIPDRIIEQQTLNVDGVTGATVTKDAIISGMLEALRKAGL